MTMLEDIGAAGDWFLRSSLEACVLICAVRVIQLALQKKLTPRWQYALWFLVLARMVMPSSLESSVSVFNLFVSSESAPVQPKAPPVAAAIPQYPAVTAPTGSFQRSSVDTDSAFPLGTVGMGETRLGRSLALPWQRFDAAGVWPLVWLAGTVLLLLRVFWGSVRLVLRVRRSPRTQNVNALAVLDECRATVGIRYRLRTVEVMDLQSPALFGLFRPWLLLPAGMANSLSEDQLRYVFLHELAHYKRQDLAVNWLLTVLQASHWFNPLVWYAFYRMRSDRELACDALALSYAAPEEAQAYGSTLLDLMERRASFRNVPALVGIAEDRSQLKRRIAAIAKFTPNSYRWSYLAVGLLVVLGGVFLTDAQARRGEDEVLAGNDSQEETLGVEEPAQEAAAETPVVGDPLQQKVTVDLKEADLRTAVSSLAKKANIQLIFDVEPTGRVSAYLQDIPLQKAIETLLRTNGYGVVIEGGFCRAYAGDEVREVARVQDGEKLDLEIKARIKYFESNKQEMNSAYDKLKDAEARLRASREGQQSDSIRQVEAATRAYERAKRTARNTAALLKALADKAISSGSPSTVEVAMRRLEAKYKELEFRRSEESLGAATAELPGRKERRLTDAERGLTDTKRPIVKLLQSPVSIAFEDIHIQEVLDFIHATYEINIALDYRYVKPQGEKQTKTRLAENQYVSDGMIPYINVRDVSLVEALKVLTRPLHLDFAAQGAIIWISSPQSLRDEPGSAAHKPETQATPPQRPANLESQYWVSPSDAKRMAADARKRLTDEERGLKRSKNRLVEILQLPVSIAFEDIHIQEIMDFIAATYEINIMLDFRVVKPNSEKPAAEDVPKKEYVTDGRIPYVNLKDISLGQALKALTHLLNLDYTVRDGFVWISSPQHIREDSPSEAKAGDGSANAQPSASPAAQAPPRHR